MTCFLGKFFPLFLPQLSYFHSQLIPNIWMISPILGGFGYKSCTEVRTQTHVFTGDTIVVIHAFPAPALWPPIAQYARMYASCPRTHVPSDYNRTPLWMRFRCTRERNYPEDPPPLPPVRVSEVCLWYVGWSCQAVMGKCRTLLHWLLAVDVSGQVGWTVRGAASNGICDVSGSCPDRPRALPCISHFAVQSKFCLSLSLYLIYVPCILYSLLSRPRSAQNTHTRIYLLGAGIAQSV